MSKIPRYFEECKADEDPSTELYPFLYDHSVKQFVISGITVALEDFDPYTFIRTASSLRGTGIDFDDMPKHALLMPSFGHVIAGPKLHEWIDANVVEAGGTARQVMFDAYKSLLENGDELLDEVEISKNSVGHMGFAAGLSEYGGIHLQVIGDCACMGASPYGYFIDDKFEEGFAEYDLHNADTQVQRASLYAGLGHIARLASGIQPAQAQLFDLQAQQSVQTKI